jgi:hypothetical protein
VSNGIELKAKVAVGGGRFPSITYQKIINPGIYSPSKLADVLGAPVNKGVVSDIRRFRVSTK